MIAHAMKYVQQSGNIRAELEQRDPLSACTLAPELTKIERRFVAAEAQLVKVYGEYRDKLRELQSISPLAARYLEETTWDLT